MVLTSLPSKKPSEPRSQRAPPSRRRHGCPWYGHAVTLPKCAAQRAYCRSLPCDPTLTFLYYGADDSRVRPWRSDARSLANQLALLTTACSLSARRPTASAKATFSPATSSLRPALG
ncbi:hypothetical protein V5799_003035 [Amblyomma americanum]|uniref:Uncharacterized protein n=1 Tax=Amblyomma americanum TaxID=6943 RepID=A0AAQ4DA48_AMBAM